AGPRRGGRDVRHYPPLRGRAGAAPAAAGLARRLGPGHPGRPTIGRLAERPRRRDQPRPYRVSACQENTAPATLLTPAQPTATRRTTAQPTPTSHSSLIEVVGWQYACSAGIFFALNRAHFAALYGCAPGALARWVNMSAYLASEI